MQRRVRRGFTLPEVLVSTAILILLAAMTVPSLVSYKNAKDARAVASLLASLSLSLNNPNGALGDQGFAQRVTKKYPQLLLDLTTPITTAKKSCSGAAYTTANVNAWAAGAPYSNAAIFTTGIPTPAGWIRDTLFTSATTNYVELRMDSVETTDAQNIDLSVDLTADSTSGVLRYEEEPSDPTNVQLHRIRYLIPKGVAADQRCRARGFSTVEILIAVAIVAILAAVTVPAIRTRLSVGDADAIVGEFQNLEQALQAFHENTTNYPQSLDELTQISTTPPVAQTSCGVDMSAAQLSRWRGPYTTRPITANYTVTADVTVENTLVRDASGTVPYLEIKMDNVEADVAAQVERELDGALNSNSPTTGSVLEAVSSGTLLTVTFRFPVRDC